MGNSDSSRGGFLKRIGDLFTRKRHPYLEQHGYYDSFSDRKYMRSPESFPYLPYSLQDIIEERKLSGLNVFVASHRSTALWLRRGEKNVVTLGRPRHNGGTGSGRLRYIDSYRQYSGPPIDIIVWDSHQMPEDWAEFSDRFLSPRGVVIFVTSHYFDALENGLGAICEHMTGQGMRLLEFRNPGPRREILAAILCYPRDNVLDI